MGEVTISVAGRAYQVVCEDGEEDRLTTIAARVDHEAQAFGGATPSLSEPRLLLMCALLLADKLDEAESALPSAAPSHAAPDVDTSTVDEATARIEALAHPDSSEVLSADTPAQASDEVEPAPDVYPEPNQRRSKSSAAMAAEKDLLSWADRSDARNEAEAETDPGDGIDTQAEVAETIAPDPAPASDEAAKEEPAPETEAEREARVRSERRQRRRERLARLAKEAGDET